MQWVETTGRSIDEAKVLALDQLGVDVDDAEFEVLEEPRPGLFGRVRGEARVRARVRPSVPRTKTERRTPRKRNAKTSDAESSGDVSNGSSSDDAAAATAVVAASSSVQADRPPRTDDRGRRDRGGRSGSRDRDGRDRDGRDRAPRERSPRPAGDPVATEVVGAEAVRFLEGLLAAYALAGTVVVEQDGIELEVNIDGDDLGVLIGPRGTTLLALQDVARVASQRRLGDHDSHLRIDVSGYRQRRREALARFTTQLIDEVRSSGTASVLEPMPSADRKVVHDTVAAADGVSSRSEGDDPFRRVVIEPVDEAVDELVIEPQLADG
jgi:spoIIIJ-associated protein